VSGLRFEAPITSATTPAARLARQTCLPHRCRRFHHGVRRSRSGFPAWLGLATGWRLGISEPGLPRRRHRPEP